MLWGKGAAPSRGPGRRSPPSNTLQIMEFIRLSTGVKRLWKNITGPRGQVSRIGDAFVACSPCPADLKRPAAQTLFAVTKWAPEAEKGIEAGA